MNTIEYAKIFQSTLDEQMTAILTSGWMEENAAQIKYLGGSEVKIPKLLLDGLGDYDRDSGFAKGAVTLSYETHQLSQDRGRTFQLDAMDVDETNFAACAANVMGEFQRAKVAPEIDAYRYSKIYALASAKGKVNATAYTPASETVLEKLLDDITTVEERVGDGEELVITMSAAAAKALDLADRIEHRLENGELMQGSFARKLKLLDGMPVIRVPSTRLLTAYVFYDGKTPSDGADSNPTPDQTPGGFAAAAGAKQINWIVMARRAPIAVSKTDRVRIFTPEQNLEADAYKLDYRKYHDLWIPDNKMDGVMVNVGA